MAGPQAPDPLQLLGRAQVGGLRRQAHLAQHAAGPLNANMGCPSASTKSDSGMEDITLPKSGSFFST
eukprot:33539-Chlamydomonas_euryale.AAC.4